MLRPDGVAGALLLRGRARDLRTDAAGRAEVLAVATLEARVAAAARRELLEIRTAPEEPAAAKLIGTPASTGFRAVVDEAMPWQREARTLLYLLLDDLPVATLVSGYATQVAQRAPTRVDRSRLLQQPDLCAGWRTGATILSEIEQTGHVPVVTGADAPPLARRDDPVAWHPLDPLPDHSMRRHRRLDLLRDGDAIAVDVLFRDSHMAPGGRETIVHEYTVQARLDPGSLEITGIEATPQVLPWVECSLAAASALEIAGRSTRGLRPHVRAELTGPATCTHLNDTLRSLEDVVALAGLLPVRETETA